MLLDFLKRQAKKFALVASAHSTYRRFRTKGSRHPLQNLKTAKGYQLKRLGTDYGGWTFVDDPKLVRATIISAGLGEDASFDVEFAKEYDARVIVVDPTPRAIAHYDLICENFGKNKSRNYIPGGNQPIEAYDLRGINHDSLVLVPKALWESATTLKFFEPNNPNHVSHSIVNFQHDYRQNTKHIEVESITAKQLLAELDLHSADLRLIKLDIEGAEIEVIADLLKNSILPNQILVEYDELNAPSPKGFERVDSIHEMLITNGYKCIWTDGQADFLYVRD